MNETPDTPISALSLMPSTAAEVGRFSKGLIDSVRNGETNPLKLLIMLRALEAVSETVREEIEEEILTEAEKHAEKKFDVFGATVERTEVGTKYHYLKTGDIEYEQLYTETESLKKRLKEREEFLKALKSPLQLVNEDTGETYQVHPPHKTSKSGVKVYLASRR